MTNRQTHGLGPEPEDDDAILNWRADSTIPAVGREGRGGWPPPTRAPLPTHGHRPFRPHPL